MAILISMGLSPEDLDDLRAKRGWLLACGVALIAAGGLALGNAWLATAASIYFVGAMLVIGGIGVTIYAFQLQQWGFVAVWLLVGVMYVLAGVAAFSNPQLASAAMTLLLALSLIVAGLFRIFTGFALRPIAGWGWLVGAGVLVVVAGAIVTSGWPSNSLWLIGALLAIDLIAYGAGLVALAIALRPRTPIE